MYTHQFGPRAGGLSVLVADREIHPVWERGGALGDLWVKGELEVVTNMTFKVGGAQWAVETQTLTQAKVLTAPPCY